MCGGRCGAPWKLNHVATASTCARRPVGSVLVAPRHPSRCRALPVGTWCAARRPESHRADRSEVTSPPCAVWWVSPCAADPWSPPVAASRTAAYNIHCHHLPGESQHPSATFLHYLSRFRAPGRASTIGARLRRPFAPLPPRPAVGQLPRPLMPASNRSRRPATAPRPCLDRSCAAARCRCSPPLTGARQPTGAPAARRRRVGERPRMTRCRCRGARGRSPPARGCPVTATSLCPAPGRPSMATAHRPSAAWGGISRRPAAAPTPPGARMPPCARPAPLRSAAGPLLNGAPVPVGRGSAPRERPSRPDRRASTARQPRSAPSEGRSALHGVLPVPCSAHQRPAGARSGLRRRA